MSLRKLTSLLMLGLLAAALFGAHWAQLVQIRSYLGAHLARQSQDAAVLLGQALAPVLANDQTGAAQILVRDYIERGIFEHVEIADERGGIVFQDTAAALPAGVPEWFAAWVRSAVPQTEVLLALAPRPSLSLRVRSTAGSAYRTAWNHYLMALGWVAGTVATIWLVTLTVLIYFRRQLLVVERQALAAAGGNYTAVTAEPRFRELQGLYAAGNTLIQSVEAQLRDAHTLTDRLRAEAYSDPLTGLGNRRAFDLRIDSVRSDAETGTFGALLLVRIDGLKDFNQRCGVEAGDALLRRVATALQQLGMVGDGALRTRMAGAEFAVLAPGVSRSDAEQGAAQLVRRLRELCDESAGLLRVNLGLSLYALKQELGGLMARADAALRRAAEQGSGAWAVAGADVDAVVPWNYDDAQWRELLESALRDRSVVLLCQPVVARDGRVLHHEVFMRLPGRDGQLIPAGAFLPSVDRLGLTKRYDRLVLELVMAHLNALGSAAMQYAVNVSPASLLDDAFGEWLYGALGASPLFASGLIIEFSEVLLRGHHEQVKPLLRRLRSLGVGASVDHFGGGALSVGHLRGLALDYVKVDAGFTRGIESNSDHRNTVRILVEVCRGSGSRVIAESVETAGEWDALKALEIDGGRGYLLGKPQAL